jgi:hypothetical protein
MPMLYFDISSDYIICDVGAKSIFIKTLDSKKDESVCNVDKIGR